MLLSLFGMQIMRRLLPLIIQEGDGNLELVGIACDREIRKVPSISITLWWALEEL